MAMIEPTHLASAPDPLFLFDRLTGTDGDTPWRRSSQSILDRLLTPFAPLETCLRDLHRATEPGAALAAASDAYARAETTSAA